MEKVARKIRNLQALADGRDPTPSPDFEEEDDREDTPASVVEAVETPSPRLRVVKRKRSASPSPSSTKDSVGHPLPALGSVLELEGSPRGKGHPSQRRKTLGSGLPSWTSQQVDLLSPVYLW